MRIGFEYKITIKKMLAGLYSTLFQCHKCMVGQIQRAFSCGIEAANTGLCNFALWREKIANR